MFFCDPYKTIIVNNKTSRWRNSLTNSFLDMKNCCKCYCQKTKFIRTFWHLTCFTSSLNFINIVSYGQIDNKNCVKMSHFFLLQIFFSLCVLPVICCYKYCRNQRNNQPALAMQNPSLSPSGFSDLRSQPHFTFILKARVSSKIYDGFI